MENLKAKMMTMLVTIILVADKMAGPRGQTEFWFTVHVLSTFVNTFLLFRVFIMVSRWQDNILVVTDFSIHVCASHG
jgi:hypothetical protein